MSQSSILLPTQFCRKVTYLFALGFYLLQTSFYLLQTILSYQTILIMLRTVLSRVFPSQARIQIAPPPLLCTRSRYSCSFQKLPPQQQETIYRSFLSAMFLIKLRSLRPYKVYTKDFNGSYRTELIKYIRSLKFSKEQENSKFEKKIVDSFLQAYEIGEGYEFKDTELTDARKKDFADGRKAVFNPTSLSQRLLMDLQQSQKIRMGNYGIGKSFGLRSFQYLSLHRFKLLNDSLLNKAKKEYKKWLQINTPGLLGEQISQKQKQEVLEKAANKLKQLPLVIYLQLKQKPSWKGFYQQLQQQFPYITIPFTPQPNLQNLSENQKEIKQQLMYETMSGNLCTKIRYHFEQLKKKFNLNDVNIVLLIDQTNYYLKSVKLLWNQMKIYQKNNNYNKYIEEQEKKWGEYLKKTKSYPKAKIISDQIRKLHFINLNSVYYYFSEMAQMEILENHNIFQQYGFTVIHEQKDDGISKIRHYGSGINLARDQGQVQMFLVVGLLLQQALAKIFKIEKDTDQQILQKIIRGVLSQKYEKQTRLKINTSYLTAAQIMQKFKKKINEFILTQLGKKFQQNIQKLAEQLRSEAIKEQISAFLDEYFKDLEKGRETMYFSRLRKKVTSALEKQQQKDIARFLRTLLQAVQMSMLDERKRKLETLKSEDKKVHSSDVLQEGAKDLYKGEFDGTLKGRMYGDEFKGKFKGTVCSGKIVKKDQKGKTLKEKKLENCRLEQFTQMTLQDVEFDGTFEGSAKGHLIGSMKGTVDGYHVLDLDMQKQWNEKCPFTLSFKEIAPFAKQFFNLMEKYKFQHSKVLPQDKQSFFQGLISRAVCEVNPDSMTIYQSKNGILSMIPTGLSNYVSKTIENLMSTFPYDQNAFNSQYDKFVTFGLSKLDLTLYIQGEKIKLVNGENINQFIHYYGKAKKSNSKNSDSKAKEIEVNNSNSQAKESNAENSNSKAKEIEVNNSKSQAKKSKAQISKVKVTGFNERFGKLVERVKFLPQGQGLGARPVTLDGNYSRNSKAIDTVLIFKKKKQQTWFITVDYSLGETQSTITNKIQAHQFFYQNTLQKDQKFNFKDRYTHYIVVRDYVYKNLLLKLNNEVKLNDYQKIIKVSQFRFEFEPRNFSNTVQTLSEDAQKMIAAYKFACKLGQNSK